MRPCMRQCKLQQWPDPKVSENPPRQLETETPAATASKVLALRSYPGCIYVFNNRRSTPYIRLHTKHVPKNGSGLWLWSFLSHCQYLIGVESLKDEPCSRSDRPIGCQAGPIFVRETTKTILREYLSESKFTTSQSQHSRVFISCEQGISRGGLTLLSSMEQYL